MLFFVSEEHVERWCRKWKQPMGGMMDMVTATRLAYDWYHDRLQPRGRRKNAEEARAIFDNLGLTGEFWSLD